MPFAQKYVVQHIKKFAYIKKKQYLCSVKVIKDILKMLIAITFFSVILGLSVYYIIDFII